ncbi:MAG TPA: 16S rRNA (adenine(1518)-N(6)/adenine(1519)-N(6))-dimethyltransferase RsmA [Candidatus Paceibacterota bacterium]|nr:16S rRNA (adenine(1518)-N(6)/adenine(1519)-N(6))-dimethyltransferase RsmA [Candidatus Paceibacterota bacterium]
MRAKKSLGQNFLKSKAAVIEIIKVANLKPEDLVLEVGPGKGVLTEALLTTGAKVIAVEKDDRLIEQLQEKFSNEIKSGKFQLIHQDILNFDFENFYKLIPISYKLIANIPYYITGTFLRKFLTAKLQPELMVLMLQKEVAKRIVAKDGKESLLSISVKAYGEPKYIKTVPAKYFSPAPKVDSAILLIKDISRKIFHDNQIDEEKFFDLVRAGFAHKRKFLVSNLKEMAPIGAISWPEKFRSCGLSEKSRAEDLSLENWRSLVTSS